MSLGVGMAMWHYPNYTMETGAGMKWVWWEMFVNLFQPSLFALGMAYVPLNMAWWGNTTLGCYCFHFYFRDCFTRIILTLVPVFAFDVTGLLLPIVIVGICLSYTTIAGPIGHYFLLSPTLIYARVAKMLKNRQTASKNKVSN